MRVQNPVIQKLQDDIAQQEATVAKLRAEGHIHTDAERHLQQLKSVLNEIR
jgi:hypothetical protein